ncbi:hypothetical protein Bca4012_050183 [Brassica carinata]
MNKTSLTESACFRSVYDNLCLWCSTIYLVVGPEISTSDNTSSSTDSDVNRFSFGFVISLWLQHGNVGIGRLWRTSAFTLQPNLVKLRPLFASVVVKTYQNPPCWFQERTLPHSSIKERTCLSFAFSMRGTFCPDTIPLKFNTALL